MTPAPTCAKRSRDTSRERSRPSYLNGERSVKMRLQSWSLGRARREV